MRTGVCLDCQQERPILARGRCRRCYVRNRRPVPDRTCKTCNRSFKVKDQRQVYCTRRCQEQRAAARRAERLGMPGSRYWEQQQPMIRCSWCQQERHHWKGGQCRSCWQSHRGQPRPEIKAMDRRQKVHKPRLAPDRCEGCVDQPQPCLRCYNRVKQRESRARRAAEKAPSVGAEDDKNDQGGVSG